jgi:hypothetical protein
MFKVQEEETKYKDSNDKLKTFYTLANIKFLKNQELLIKDL